MNVTAVLLINGEEECRVPATITIEHDAETRMVFLEEPITFPPALRGGVASIEFLTDAGEVVAVSQVNIDNRAAPTGRESDYILSAEEMTIYSLSTSPNDLAVA